MHAQVTMGQIQPPKMQEAIQIINESIIPAIKQQPGLISLTDLMDRSTGKVMAVTLFETEADMKAGMSSGFVQQQLAKLAPLLAGRPVTEFYEVLAHE
jgi:heme-degrading monooxygenase HmoA